MRDTVSFRNFSIEVIMHRPVMKLGIGHGGVWRVGGCGEGGGEWEGHQHCLDKQTQAQAVQVSDSSVVTPDSFTEE